MRLETHQLTKSFGGVHAVDHIDVAFDGGKITALVGPNGSGKTTLINILTGLEQIDEGTVVINDAKVEKIRSAEVAARGVTRTFQNSRLILQVSVLDNALLVLGKRNVFRALVARHTHAHVIEAQSVLSKLDLWDKREELAENLSFGQRKLLEIARALLMKSSFYFFDEPFAGLFPEMVGTVSNIMRELREGGAAVVLIEHDMQLVRELADHCYVLDSGRVIASGTPEETLKQPRVIEAYLGK